MKVKTVSCGNAIAAIKTVCIPILLRLFRIPEKNLVLVTPAIGDFA
ncbi:hypothetical protein IQ259_16650 [Fortiea sp. LEGE XX443]|nr:hypothetical protein [Fortiea sp. LEGE XX443]MBE9006650.1 hypothetical protein [Fortiea sp. LEGE XX443]